MTGVRRSRTTSARAATPAGPAISAENSTRPWLPSLPVVVVAAVVLVLVTLDVWLGGPLTHLDAQISRHIGGWGLRYYTWPRRLLTILLWPGQRGVIVVVGVLLVGWLTWTRRRSDPAVRFVLALIAVAVLVYAGKFAIDRPAPGQLAEGLRHGASYPSGHLANAVLVWGVLDRAVSTARADPRLRAAVRVVRIIAPAAILVGMTLLDYHWFTDFVGGAAAGVLLLALVARPRWSSVSARIDRALGWTAPTGARP